MTKIVRDLIPVLPKWLDFLVGGSGSQGRRAGGASAAATRAADDGGDQRRGDALPSVINIIDIITYLQDIV